MTDQLAQPTPGPYEVRRNSIGEREICAGGYIIAVMCGGLGPDEEESNANLFAASWATAAKRDWLRERVSKLETDLACANTGGLKLLYSIRKELGWNDKTSLSIMDMGVNKLRNRAEAAEAKRDQLVKVFGELMKALDDMLKMYVEMVESGDCGFWDAEEVDEVIAARAVLDEARQS